MSRRREVWAVMIALLGSASLAFMQGKGGCGGSGGMTEAGGPSHMCCGDVDSNGPPGEYRPPAPGDGDTGPGDGSTAEACRLRVSLIEADADYSSDLYLDGGPPDLLFQDAKADIGEVAERSWDGSGFLFFITVHAPHGDYDVRSDTQWAEISDLRTGAWRIGFEDVPDPAASDFDFNDAVITVEAVDCPGISSPAPEISGGIVVPAGGASRVHANYLQASFGRGNLYLDGDQPELIIDKAVSGQGASARNFFAAGEKLVFILDAGTGRYYSSDPAAARTEQASNYNYRINYDTDGDGAFTDAIVHIVLTPNGAP